MNTNNTTTLFLTFAAAGIAIAHSCARTADAAVIYSETFSGSSGTNLTSGPTPDGNNWIGTANDTYKQDGTVTGTGTVRRTAYLPFTLVQGRTYTLQADATPDGNSADWSAIGFSLTTNDGNTVPYADGGTIYAWMLVRENNSQAIGRGGPNVDANPTAALNGGVSNLTNTDTLKVVLDTTNALDYVAEFFRNGTSLGTKNIGAPALTAVWIGNEGTADGAQMWDNFIFSDDTVAQVVPEPGSLALLAVAGVCGLLVLLRRRNQGSMA